ncbi:MAG TPA: sn-glycerol-3-phosphate ABC transporter ATP-binding protein UgpC [Longimicrobiales bacterium]
MARVKLEEVRKVYDDGQAHLAVRDVSFEVRDGEFVVLVGPSGCGKSTILRMIAGLESVTAGRIYIGDRMVNEVPPKDRDIAMVFQSYALYPHMSVYDNLAFALKLRKLPREEIERRVRWAAEVLGIEGILGRKPRQLSGGQRQRVALGRAIVREPAVFLFDEPLSNLDARLRVQMRTEILRLHRQLGATTIYVTHDQVDAMTMGDRLVVLDAGEVQQIDTPLEVYRRPANRFVAGFIGSPPMNFVRGVVVRGEGLRYCAEGNAFTLPLGDEWGRSLGSREGREVILGIRPEDIDIAGSRRRGGRVAEARLVVEMAELLGNEILLHASSLGHRLIARVAPQPLPGPGEAVDLVLDLDKLHFFDPETERALEGGVPA